MKVDNLDARGANFLAALSAQIVIDIGPTLEAAGLNLDGAASAGLAQVLTEVVARSIGTAAKGAAELLLEANKQVTANRTLASLDAATAKKN